MSESKPIQFYLLRSLPRIKNPACLKLEVKPINPNLSVFTSETSPGLPLLKQTVHVLNVEAEVSSPNPVILGRLSQEKLKDFEDIKLVHYGMAPSVHWIAKPTTNAAPFPSNSPMQVTANQGPVKMMPVSSGALAGTQYAHQLLVGRCGTMELIPPSDKLDKYLNNLLNTLPDKHMLQNKEVEIKNHDLLPSCRVKSFPLGTNADVWQRSEMAYFTPAAYAETAITEMNLLISAWKTFATKGGLEPNSEFFMGFPKIQKKLNSWAMIAAENSNSELDAQLNALILRAVETMITYMDILWELFYGPLLSVLDLDLSVHFKPNKTGKAKTDLSPLDKATINKVRDIFEEFKQFKWLFPVAKKTGNAAYFKKMLVKKPLDCDSYYGIVCVKLILKSPSLNPIFMGKITQKLEEFTKLHTKPTDGSIVEEPVNLTSLSVDKLQNTFDEFLLRHLASTADSDLYTAVGFNWLNAQDASGRPHLQGPFDASFPGPNIEIEFMFNCSNRIIIGTKTKKKSSTIRELFVVSGSKVIHRLSYPTEWIELESEVSNWFTNPPFVSGSSLFKVGTNKLCQVYVFVVNFQDCIENAANPPKMIWKKHEQIIIKGRPPTQPRRAPGPPPMMPIPQMPGVDSKYMKQIMEWTRTGEIKRFPRAPALFEHIPGEPKPIPPPYLVPNPKGGPDIPIFAMDHEDYPDMPIAQMPGGAAYGLDGEPDRRVYDRMVEDMDLKNRSAGLTINASFTSRAFIILAGPRGQLDMILISVIYSNGLSNPRFLPYFQNLPQHIQLHLILDTKLADPAAGSDWVLIRCIDKTRYAFYCKYTHWKGTPTKRNLVIACFRVSPDFERMKVVASEIFPLDNLNGKLFSDPNPPQVNGFSIKGHPYISMTWVTGKRAIFTVFRGSVKWVRVNDSWIHPVPGGVGVPLSRVGVQSETLDVTLCRKLSTQFDREQKYEISCLQYSMLAKTK